MAKKPPISGVREATRKVAAPFWERVAAAGLDRFFLERLLRALLRRWKDDRFARVKQGGLHGDARAELSRVFIDLDVTPDGLGDPMRPHESERIVASWMRAPRKSAFRRGRRAPSAGFEVVPSVPLEVVLGGPGQGKSTVGRFLTLIHASILLLTAPIEGIVSAADSLHLEALLAGLSAEKIPLPKVLRLPVWVELRDLTDALLRDDKSERDALGALQRWYARTELREIGDVPAVEAALTSLPWVIVFDGLDEVPPERGRALVSACVAGIRDRFAITDGHVIGTSRPQSYDRKVFGDDLVERTLLPLKPERAATYTERFATCLYAEEEGERALLLKRMRKALENPATAALMQNPLLVTIMASIVIHHGEPSDRRWTLFEEYYRTLYRRETERGTYASSTLRDHADLIHAIHMHVGMSLQARTEEVAGVSALMPEHELRMIIREHLLKNHSPEETARLAGEILRAAEQRLVLLAQSQEGMYGFELRSFQEFMAAWQLISLREAPIDALLLRLAPLDAWRNVVLFAIGQQYANGSSLARERSVGLCVALNNSSEPGMKVVLHGSRLAIAVLRDAPYGKASKPRDELIDCALELLSTPPAIVHSWLAGLLWKVDPEHLLAVLDDALRDPVRADAAWIALLTLPTNEQTQALADRHWPVAYTGRRAIVRAYSRRFRWLIEELNLWIGQKVAEDLTLAEPAEAESIGVMLYRMNIIDVHIRSKSREFGLGWSCGSVKVEFRDLPELLQVMPIPAPWTIMRSSAMLQENLTASQLALVLDELIELWDERSVWYWPWDVPWPLLTCFMSAQSRDDLRIISARLRRGELGDGGTWRKVERKFRSTPFENVKALAASADPLHAILVEGVMPPIETTRNSYVDYPVNDLIDHRLVFDLDTERRNAKSLWVQRMIAQMMLLSLEGWRVYVEAMAASQVSFVGDLIQLINVSGVELNLAWLNRVSSSLGNSDAVTILNRTTSRIVADYQTNRDLSLRSLIPAIQDALLVTPSSQRLQRALILSLQSEAEHGRTCEIVVEPQGDGVDAWLLRFVSAQATYNDIPTLARLLAATDDEQMLHASLSLFAAQESALSSVVPIVEALVALPEVSSSLRSAAVEFLAKRFARSTMDLVSPQSWAAVGLPAPAPMPELPNRVELPGAQIASVEIDNLRAFAQPFEVKAPDLTGSGQWMVFLGENATGKTTLLRAIGMALASASDAAAVPSNLEGPLRRDSSREGLVRVRTKDGRDLKTTVTGPAGDERVAIVEAESILRPWVVGYGCRRGSAISGTDMDNAFVPFRDLDNLFDRPRGVIRVSGWLKELQRLAINNGPRSRAVFEAARAALRKVLLGAENIVVENEVHVEFANRRTVPLTLLSDGYLTTAGWVVDLMARWLKRNEGRKEIDERFCEVMEGVVLLDEIDLHLHPRWQERVIEDVRGLFPKMTFIATTHHPLTLRGARKGEVFVLDDHERTGIVTAVQRDIPPGTRVDELLTGEWFNRPSAIVDAETREMLDEHQRLIVAGAKAGDPKRKSLESKLRRRLGRYADTSLERFAATIVAQHLDKSLPEPSAKKREEVRASVLKILKRRDAKRG